jgi:multidrug resistance efflux pump
MARNLVLKDGVLSAVVESFEQVEVAQLEAEVTAKQEAVDSLQTQADQVNLQLDEAKEALEDSKSDFTRAKELVEPSPDPAAGESTDDASAAVVHVAVENL